MKIPAVSVLGRLLFFQPQSIPDGNSPPFLGVIYLAVTGLSEFGRGSPTVLLCVLPLIGYRFACFSLKVGCTGWSSYPVYVGSFVSRPETNVYAWFVVFPNVPTTANANASLTWSSVTPDFSLAFTCMWIAESLSSVLTPKPYEYLLNLFSVLFTAWIKSWSLLFPLNVSRISPLYSLPCLISKALKYVNFLQPEP